MNIFSGVGPESLVQGSARTPLPNDRIRESLVKLCPVFCSTAIDTIQVMLRQKCEVHLPWEIVEQLQGQFDRILTLGCSSTNYSAIVCIGIQRDSVDAFIGTENASVEQAADVLGELANNYCGLLSDNDEFRRAFGTLTQAVPALYLDGNSFLPFIWGAQGYLYFGEHWVYFGYSVRNNTGFRTPQG